MAAVEPDLAGSTVSLRAADARFVLPGPVRRAVVSDTLPGWRDALRAAGYEVTDLSDPWTGTLPGIDLVVAPLGPATTDPALDSQQCLLTGWVPSGPLRRRGLHTIRYLALAGSSGPRVLVPLNHRAAVRYLLTSWSRPRSRMARLRNRLVSAAVRFRVPVDRVVRGSVLTAAVRRTGQPLVLARAATDGAPLDGEWILVLGDGDDLQRAVFHVFATDSQVPVWAVKLSRVSGYSLPFDRDEVGLHLAAEAGPLTAAHAPRLIGRCVVESLHVSVETAAVGRPMHEFLISASPAQHKRQLVEAVAAWTLALGRESRSDPVTLAAERVRLRELATATPGQPGLAGRLVDDLGPTAGVLQHNDLGCWNVVVNGDDFTVLDWESARGPGLPLWDLVYFLTDALLRLESGYDRSSVTDRVVRLFRGELASSELLFRWIRVGAEAAGVPPESVGPIVTLGWLHHAASPEQRAQRLGDLTEAGTQTDRRAEITLWARTLPAWLDDPCLGPTWTAWQR
jgi:hypothetical protein